MRHRLFFCFSLFCIQFSHAEVKKVFFKYKSSKVSLDYFHVLNARISKTRNCINKKCISYSFLTGQSTLPRKIKWTTGGVNPTSTLCKAINGNPKIGYLPNSNEVSLCYFSDGSFIFAWDLMKLFKKNINRL